MTEDEEDDECKDTCDSCGREVAAAYLGRCDCGAWVCPDCFIGNNPMALVFCKLCDPSGYPGSMR
jgi:hypothetical protein